jgi:hypothetical protein
MDRPVVIVVRPGVSTRTVLGWLRRLLPAAILLVSSANFGEAVTSELIVLENIDVEAGPLGLADAIHRKSDSLRESD